MNSTTSGPAPTTAPTTAPTAIPVETTPPTAVIAGFAHYPVGYCLVEQPGGYRLSGGSSAQTLTGSHYARREGVQIIAEHIAPDGSRVVTEPWAGGNWAGMCGSTCWVLDPDDEIKNAEAVLAALAGTMAYAQRSKMDSDVSRTQFWWITGRRTRTDGWDGFRVECSQPMRHEGLCTAENRWTWDPKARTPIIKDLP